MIGDLYLTDGDQQSYNLVRLAQWLVALIADVYIDYKLY
jgi:hypothetical protein